MEENKQEEKETKEQENIQEKVKKLSEDAIDNLINRGLEDSDSIDILYKLVDIHKDISQEEYWKRKENMYMNYGNYNRGNYNAYGEYNRGYGEYNDGYGRRGVDSKYRGYGHLDRMYNEYGNYNYGRERYGTNEESKKSLKYMLESMEDFARMLKEEAQSQEEVQMIKQTAQRIAQM